MPAAIPAVAAIGGAVISGAASKSAAKTQANSAREATEAQERAMERQIQLQEPWRQAGGLGLNALAYGLGLSPTGTFTPGSGGGGSVGGGMETPEQIRERLTAQYVTNTPTAGAVPLANGAEGGSGMLPVAAPMTTERRIDEAALSTAVQAEVRRQQQAEAARLKTATATASRDPRYGNLLREFGMADFQRDPGAQFRQEEGERGLNRASAARGMFTSGRAAKDLLRFNSGLASQEFGAAFDRFNVNKTNTFNRLASISGIGQTAANQTGAAVSQFGQQQGNNLIGAGNAIAAGRVGGANALTGGIGQGISAYQNQTMMDRFFGGGGGGDGGMRSYGSPGYRYSVPSYENPEY